MSYTFSKEVTLVTEQCCNCGVTFAMPQFLKKKLLETGHSFYCPSGHGQHYAESVSKKLRAAEEALKREKEAKQFYQKRREELREELGDTKNKLRGQKAANTKLKKRIKNGVCPCCHRQFVNLQRHMKTKHPEYGGGNEGQV